MAKFLSSAVGGDIRGKIGSSVFSRNKGGAYIRTKVTPVNPKTPAQQLVRQNFGQNSKKWSGTLTQSQRDAWNAFAASNPVRDVFGNSITLTGLATFNRMNQILLQIGSFQILNPPADYSVTPIANPTSISTAVASDATAVVLHWPTTPDGEMNTSLYVFATPPLAPGKTPNANLFRYITNISTDSLTAASVSVGVAYNAIFGEPITGKNIWVDVGQVNALTGAVLTGIKLSNTTA